MKPSNNHFRIGIFWPSLFILAIGLTSCQPGTATMILSSTLPALSSPLPASPTPSTTHTPIPTMRSPSSPTATPDFSRLDEPPLPANPTQLEIGRHLFWLNCMTCHGDNGQGLTDEFRSLYVEDANCWARGCHGGRSEDQGFPIPTSVPAIISSKGDLLPFQTPEQLFEYLRTTHPPQNPGFMPDSDYWALTAYLLNQNGRLSPDEVLGDQ